MQRLRILIVVLVVVPGAWVVSARQTSQPGPAKAPLDTLLNALTFRNIGVFRTAAWVTDIAVPESPAREHAYTIYAAARSGGLWKTVNAGTTWECISDSVGAAAVGAVALAPSQPTTVWMGTGDQANARSSYSGKGVFKSTDAGQTWQFMGLADSHHIARIVVHPKNPDVVYVAAVGHLFSRNEERGVFRTLDGGRTWKKVLYINDGVGAIDLVINRKRPAVLYAAMYDKQRRPWQIVESGPESGIYGTDNGGDTWQRLAGGLPTNKLGRIGLDLYQKNPSILYALIENQNPRPAKQEGAAEARAGAGGQRGQGPLASNIIGNELYRTDDGGRTWRKMTDVNVAGGKAPYSFNQIRVDPNDDGTVIVTSDSMFISRDAGKTWDSNFFRGTFGDFRAMWWDPEDSKRLILGSDGGVSVSVDGGRTADNFPNMRIGEVYAVGVDMDDPYNVYGGLQDHDSWKGPSNGPTGRITLENWVTVGPGDGMYNVVDPTDSRWVYNTREQNQMGRMDQRTGIRTNIAPTRPAGQPRLRFNWIAPIALSPHNPQIVYAGAQVLFRSLDRGDHWQEISPDLTRNDPARIGLNVPYCTITSISESPLVAGVIWVGTDDGKVWVTRNHGGSWTDLTNAVAAAGGPPERWVSRVFASPHDPGTALVAKNGFRDDDFAPYLYRTTDFGQTFTSISSNLPAAPINVVVQDRRNRDLLIVGNDIGVFVSLDGGAHWSRLQSNLPTVAVHDLTIHPRENDLVLGTYGRGFWVGDISPLQNLAPGTLDKRVFLFDIEPRTRYGFSTQGMNYHLFGDRYIQAPNEPDAMAINYWLKEDATPPSPPSPQMGGGQDGSAPFAGARQAAGGRGAQGPGPAMGQGPARITISDIQGRTVAQLSGPARAGLNRVLWNMLAPPATGQASQSAGGRGRGGFGPPVPQGEYVVTLEAAGEKISKVCRVRERIR